MKKVLTTICLLLIIITPTIFLSGCQVIPKEVDELKFNIYNYKEVNYITTIYPLKETKYASYALDIKCENENLPKNLNIENFELRYIGGKYKAKFFTQENYTEGFLVDFKTIPIITKTSTCRICFDEEAYNKIGLQLYYKDKLVDYVWK